MKSKQVKLRFVFGDNCTVSIVIDISELELYKQKFMNCKLDRESWIFVNGNRMVDPKSALFMEWDDL
jgi:hypothetical protein